MKAVDKELAELYFEFMAAGGRQLRPPSRLVNKVSTTSFNYSIEEPLLDQFASYAAIDAPLNVGVLQPCIRTGDFARNRGDSAWRHSTFFHMLAIQYAFCPGARFLRELHSRAIHDLVAFLCEDLGLTRRNLFVTCFSGGFTDEICGRERAERIYVPPDTNTVEFFRREGLPESNIRRQASIDNLLVSFHEDIDFYAGTKYEVLYRFPDASLIEIGTGECIRHIQKRSAGRLIDIVPLDISGAPLVVGLERLASVLRGEPNLFKIGLRAELVRLIRGTVSSADSASIFRAVDALLPCTVVLGQVAYNDLNSSLRGRMRAFIRAVRDSLGGQYSLSPVVEQVCAVVRRGLHPSIAFAEQEACVRLTELLAR